MAKRKPSPELKRFQYLMQPKISLERAWYVLNTHTDRAATSTVEALMYALRSGVETLGQRNTQSRISELSDEQVIDVMVRLQKFKREIAPAWTPKQVEILAAVRNKLNGHQ
jgi:hypothetical protein